MKRTLALILPWLLLLVIAALPLLLRYGLVESAELARVCDAGKTLACEVRHITVLGFITGNIGGLRIGVFGWVALAAMLLALWHVRVFTAWLAAATGLFAVVLYCFEPGALALLVGCLRLVRAQANGVDPADQHGATQREIGAHP
ncbi:MAG TPA: hypothetical protein VFG49_01345 [Dyella sp.]|uniref:hypothetical protein n=1 Tax=Dyella sp. TaxID=1869338 RepID=UPI002D79DDBE|nr:hypothetical protein [Dyella sp.]HET6552156.1 hypothetical protein [Dyella sp.]